MIFVLQTTCLYFTASGIGSEMKFETQKKIPPIIVVQFVYNFSSNCIDFLYIGMIVRFNNNNRLNLVHLFNDSYYQGNSLSQA